MKRKFAFTLAEVLTTLGVIGVVAAITMPTLIQNHKKMQTVTQLKKAYSEINQALQMAILEYGDYKNWDLSGDNDFDASLYFSKKYVEPYLKVIKKCNGDNTGECNFNVASLNGVENYFGTISANSEKLFLSDGNEIVISKVIDGWYAFIIDINGNKGPNIQGKDVFQFEVNSKGLFRPRYNFSNPTSDLTDRCHKNRTGNACAASIVQNGWKISDDYPW